MTHVEFETLNCDRIARIKIPEDFEIDTWWLEDSQKSKKVATLGDTYRFFGNPNCTRYDNGGIALYYQSETYTVEDIDACIDQYSTFGEVDSKRLETFTTGDGITFTWQELHTSARNGNNEVVHHYQLLIYGIDEDGCMVSIELRSDDTPIFWEDYSYLTNSDMFSFVTYAG